MKHFIPLSLLPLALAVSSRAQSVTFATVATYGSGGSGTIALAAQDLNGDGKPDVVLTNANSATVGVLLNTGTGTFPATATTYSTAGGTSSPNTNSVAIGDVNADGKADIAALNSTAGTVGVLLGTGTGTFGTVTTYSVGSFTYPSSLALADVNNDGRADVLVANTSPSSVGVLLSRSTGGFASVVQYPTNGGNLNTVTAGDLNGDGKPDLVLGTSDGVSVLLNSGTGTFPASSTNYAGARASGLKVGDVTGDGRPDVVAANYFDNTVSVFPGSSTGSLGTAVTYSAGSGTSPTAVALGDLNKDGRLDIVAANSNYGSAGVLLRAATGSFPATATQFSVGSNSAPNDVVVADLNGDTKPDLITANFNNARAGVLLNTSVLATQPALTAANVALLPNPAQGSCRVLVPGVAGATTLQAELRTALGQLVWQQVLALPAAGTTCTFSTAGLAPGVYLVQLRAGEHTLVQRLAVE